MKALIDTCVILDFLENREPFGDTARKLFLMVASETIDGYISSKGILDTHYMLRKYFKDEKKTREAIEGLFKVFKIVDTKAIEVRRAVLSDTSDYEDAVMIETAIDNDMDCIITRNIKDYKLSPIDVFTPEMIVSCNKA